MLQFVRQIPIQIVIAKALSERRGFLFYVAAGFSKEVDPLSGMTVNLMKVDEWLQTLKEELEESLFISETESLNHAFAEVMAVIRLNLAEQAETEGASLTSLTLKEERGWSLSWSHSMSPEEMLISRTHYLESFSSTSWDLIKLHLKWLRHSGCEADYAHEGFKLLRSIKTESSSLLFSELKKLVGTKLSSGSALQSIEMEYPGKKYSLLIS
ncbi:hypothetical protein D3C87_123330 [compost metagenome]